MQNPHHWKKKKEINKINKIKMVSSSRSSLSFMKELKWNRRHDFCYILYTQTGDNWNLKLCLLVGGGVGQQLNTYPPPSPERDTSGVRRLRNGEGGRQVITWRTWCGETRNRQRLKMVKSNRSRERERSVMYNIIYTLQLGLHLELRTSPKEVTF